MDSNPKTRYGTQKPSMNRIPPAAMLHLGVVMDLGARKYGPFNWREHDVSTSVYLDAAQRHIENFKDLRDIDPESGACELAHAMACFSIIIDAQANGNLIDDRAPTAGVTNEMIDYWKEHGTFAGFERKPKLTGFPADNIMPGSISADRIVFKGLFGGSPTVTPPGPITSDRSIVTVHPDQSGMPPIIAGPLVPESLVFTTNTGRKVIINPAQLP